MRRFVTMVRMNELHTLKQDFPKWELPLVEHVHGRDAVKITGEARCNLRVPDPAEEYQRLERRYGVNKETLVPRVAEVFGSGPLAITRLTEAMQEDLDEQAALDKLEAAEAAKAPAGELSATGTDAISGAVLDERKGGGGKRSPAPK